ncbi:MAG: hypothetical protein K5793_04275 [Nitrosarchaeum sp.]|nr:hypothetical protein [Nitrosarchaeum sp.]
MAIVNISRAKVSEEIQREFPTMRTPESYADVLLAAVQLHATDMANPKTRWQFLNQGVKQHAFSQAYAKYGLLDRKEAPRVRILKYARGPTPKGDAELKKALDFERHGLYTHLTISSTARGTIADELGVRNSVTAIKTAIEHGSIRQQVDIYAKIFFLLQTKGQYNKSYNYVLLGFRYLPDKYWLSNLAKRILAKC